MTIAALLLTLVLIFAFQAENLTTRWFAVVLIAVPGLIRQPFFTAIRGRTIYAKTWAKSGEHHLAI